MPSSADPLDRSVPRLPLVGVAEQLASGLASAVDAAILAAVQPLLSAFVIPPADELERLRASAEPLLAPELQRDPRSFFAYLDEPPRPAQGRVAYRRSIPGGVAVGRRLPSHYGAHAFESGLDERDRDLPQTIAFEHWCHTRRPPRATVVALHGFAMGRPRMDAFALFAGQWFERGLDVVLLTLPYHGSRAPAHVRFSGEHFAVPDIARVSAAVHQAVFEIREVIAWLRGNSQGPVGLLGLSLGGYLTALMAGLVDDLDFAVPIVPPVCMGDLAWGYLDRSRKNPADRPPSMLSREELRTGFRVHSPLAHALKIPRERVMIVAGRGDRVVPPEHPHSLWVHWGEPEIHWFAGSHVAQFGRSGIVEAVLEHLRSLAILDGPLPDR